MVILLHDFHVTDEEENITSTIGRPSNDFCGIPIKSPIFSRTNSEICNISLIKTSTKGIDFIFIVQKEVYI